MKKTIYLSILISPVFGLVQCDTRTYNEISGPTVVPTTVKYNIDVKPIIQNNCVVCHSSTGDASFYPLTNYTETKNAIDNIIDRISRPAGDPEKMPQGGALSQSQIDLIKKWKNDGLQEN